MPVTLQICGELLLNNFKCLKLFFILPDFLNPLYSHHPSQYTHRCSSYVLSSFPQCSDLTMIHQEWFDDVLIHCPLSPLVTYIYFSPLPIQIPLQYTYLIPLKLNSTFSVGTYSRGNLVVCPPGLRYGKTQEGWII